MANKLDVEKLFNDKFNDFSPELSPNALETLDAKLKTAMIFRWAKWILIASVVIATSWVAYEMLDTVKASTKSELQELVLPNTQKTIDVINSEKGNINSYTESKLADSLRIVEEERFSEPKIQANTVVIVEEEVKTSENTSNIVGASDQQRTNDKIIKIPIILSDEKFIMMENNSKNSIELIEDTNIQEENNEDVLSIVKPEFDESESVSIEEAIQETLSDAIGMSLVVEVEQDQDSMSNGSSTSITEKEGSKNNTSGNKNKAKAKKRKSKNLKFAKPTKIESYGNIVKKFEGFLDINAGAFVFNNTSNPLQLYSDSLTTTNFEQNPQLSHEFGMGFQLKLKGKPWLLYTGINYQVFKEKIDYKWSQTYEDSELSYWTYDSDFSIEQVIDTFFIIVDTNHFVIDTIFTQDTMFFNVDSAYNAVMTTDEKSKKYTNTYTYLNIPLMIGYEFQTANKNWNFQVLGGAAIAINLSNEGYYYSKDGGILEYSGKVNPSLTWRLMAAANINYQWKKWQFYIQPEFQYQLNESEVPNQPIRRKYQLYKVRAGIRFKLF